MEENGEGEFANKDDGERVVRTFRYSFLNHIKRSPSWIENDPRPATTRGIYFRTNDFRTLDSNYGWKGPEYFEKSTEDIIKGGLVDFKEGVYFLNPTSK